MRRIGFAYNNFSIIKTKLPEILIQHNVAVKIFKNINQTFKGFKTTKTNVRKKECT